MKKILLFVLISMLAITSSFAQKLNKISQKAENVNLANTKHNILDKNYVINYNSELLRVPQNVLKQKAKIKSKDLSQAYRNSYNSTSSKNEHLASVPDNLLGTYQCKGVSYFGGIVTGETIIRLDESDENKIWISNLVPGGSNLEVYGTLSADQTIISISQGQKIYEDGTDQATLAIYGSADPVTAKFDAQNGVINVQSDLWGAEGSDGWFELFTGEVTYTKADMLPPTASYIQPVGGLFLGLTPDTWDAYNATALINPAYTTWEWKNINIEEDVSYKWDYTDSLSRKNYTSSIDSLLMDVAESYYGMPKLTATNDKGSSGSFILGADYQNKGNESYCIAGGNAGWLGFDENCDYGVANMDNGFTLLRAGENSYFFGTGVADFADDNIESLLVFYEEPILPVYFEGVNVYLFELDGPEDTELTMNIVLAEEDEEESAVKGEVIASSTISIKDAVPIIYNEQVVGYTLMFTSFENIDVDGFSTEMEYMEMDKAFFLELSGFNKPDVSLAVCTEEINPADGESRSNFIVEGEDSSIYSWVDFRQTMYFNLSGCLYSYISLQKNTVYDDGNGGTYEDEAIPYFDTLTIVQDSIPEWVSVELNNEEYSESKWGATVSITFQPLPSGSEPRDGYVLLKTTAATRKIHVVQGGAEPTSIDNDYLSSIYAVKNKNGFLVSYPSEMNEINIYSASGVFLGRYNLPESGKYQLSNVNMQKGLYILELQGSGLMRTIKIMN